MLLTIAAYTKNMIEYHLSPTALAVFPSSSVTLTAIDTTHMAAMYKHKLLSVLTKYMNIL